MNKLPTREQIIYSMCLAMRNEKRDPNTLSHTRTLGDYIGTISDFVQERQILWDRMARIYDECIEPYMEFKKQDKSND
jgi:hypothetical protein